MQDRVLIEAVDPWSRGYREGLDGATYDQNPYGNGKGGSAWAFGCSEGMAERNRQAFRAIIEALRGMPA